MTQRADVMNETDKHLELPFKESLKIAVNNIMIRFGRAAITASGTVLSIAFLVYVLSGNALEQAANPEAASGLAVRSTWLVVMSLLVCVVGIANSILMSVTERFKEIGTMKCLGAQDSFVVKLFLLESGMLGLLGSLTGSVMGVVFALMAKSTALGKLTAVTFPYARVFGAMGFALAVGVVLSMIGTSFPAYRAAKLPPAAALRTEI